MPIPLRPVFLVFTGALLVSACQVISPIWSFAQPFLPGPTYQLNANDFSLTVASNSVDISADGDYATITDQTHTDAFGYDLRVDAERGGHVFASKFVTIPVKLGAYVASDSDRVTRLDVTIGDAQTPVSTGDVIVISPPNGAKGRAISAVVQKWGVFRDGSP